MSNSIDFSIIPNTGKGFADFFYRSYSIWNVDGRVVLNFPLEGYSYKDLSQLQKDLADLFETHLPESKPVSIGYCTGFGQLKYGINIPEHLIPALDEVGARKFFNLMLPHLKRIIICKKSLEFLKKSFPTLDFFPCQSGFEEAEMHLPRGFHALVDYPNIDYADQSLENILNRNLQEDLFVHVQKSLDRVRLFISQDDVVRLASNPNLKKCKKILKNPQQECLFYTGAIETDVSSIFAQVAEKGRKFVHKIKQIVELPFEPDINTL